MNAPQKLNLVGDVAQKLASVGNDVKRLAFMAQLHEHSEVLARFCKHPALVELARQLLGPDVDQAWNQMIIKAPEIGKPFAWHQDAQYAHTVPMDPGFTAWIAITDTTVENGTLRILPRLHREGLLPHVWNEQNAEWRCTCDGSQAVTASLRAGQALVFGRLVPHASGANLSSAARMAYQIAYQPPGARLCSTGETFGDQVPVLRAGKPV